MKYIVLVGDGMADRPIEELGGRTPLEVAKTPNMDEIATRGRIGLAKTVPEGMEPASDVANLSILGYDPARYYTGRGPLEAANLGVELKTQELAFRCNLITVDNETLIDYSANHIATEEAAALINYLNKKMHSKSVSFHPGVSYRHIVVIKDKERFEGLRALRCTPPHNITKQRFSEYLPAGEHQDFIRQIMFESRKLLKDHEVNQVRIDLGENPANMIWLWGQGSKPDLPSFKEKYKVTGSVISAVDLIKGLGRIIGLKPLKVVGATGYYDTNYLGKAKKALESLEENDFVFVHVEAPDEAGHNGDLRAKIGAIENFDRDVVGTILKNVKAHKDYRILVLPDHPTPIELKTHSADPVCFAICGKDIAPDEAKAFNEKQAHASNFLVAQGHTLMDYLMSGKI